MLIGFSIINHPFWGTTILGNLHMGTPKHQTYPDFIVLGAGNTRKPWVTQVCSMTGHCSEHGTPLGIFKRKELK